MIFTDFNDETEFTSMDRQKNYSLKLNKLK